MLKAKIIVNNDLELSNICQDDLDALIIHANNFEIAKNLRDVFPYPYTANDAGNFIKIAENNTNILAIRLNGQLIGTIGITPGSDIHKNQTELGFWIGQQYWNKGIMSACIKSYSSYIFENFDFNRIYCEVFSDNISSIKVLEKCGFVKEGVLRQSVIKNGQIKDTYIYALLKPVK